MLPSAHCLMHSRTLVTATDKRALKVAFLVAQGHLQGIMDTEGLRQHSSTLGGSPGDHEIEHLRNSLQWGIERTAFALAAMKKHLAKVPHLQSMFRESELQEIGCTPCGVHRSVTNPVLFYASMVAHMCYHAMLLP
jgi:hypothetical protein